MSIVGGALLPPLFGAISDMTGNIQHGYAVPLLCFLVTGWFARTTLRHAATAGAPATQPQGSTAQHV
jgi:FHS family L-fucose permease-like MFS transporter